MIKKGWHELKLLFQIVSGPCIFAPILLYFLPESPRWLIAQGRISEAKAILLTGAKRNGIEMKEEDTVLKPILAVLHNPRTL